MKSITPEELAKNDGKEGRPAYVAHDGKVYDVTNSRLWKDGQHMRSHPAGANLSLELQAAPHGTVVLERMELVGELAQPQPTDTIAEFPQPGALAAAILKRHPHPISVHFPIALCLAAAIFTVIGVLFDLPALEATAFYNLIFAFLAAPGAVATGLLSWTYNYGAIWTPIYKKKALLSVLLGIVLLGALGTRLAAFGGGASADILLWTYRALTIVSAPIVMGLGFLGGRITFPSE